MESPMEESPRPRKKSRQETRPHPTLPICNRCRAQKTKCDRKAPKCSGCHKSDDDCIIADPFTGKEYTREFIHALEEKERRLQTTLNSHNLAPAQSHHSETPNSRTSPISAPVASHKGESHGLGFFRSLVPSTEPNESPLQYSGENSKPLATKHLKPNPWPCSEEASSLLNNFFDRFQIHHTFLLRQSVWDAFHRVYGSSNPSDAKPIDHFRILMIFAISSITRYRAGQGLEHPYGYYLAAQSLLDQVPLIGSIEAIENLLLIARFGMYHRCGVSQWEASRLCMRQCIEWGLHKQPTTRLEPLQEQRRRRIFWESYLLDRNSTGFVGRPFAIPEADIVVDLPVDADDDYIQQSGVSSLSNISDISINKPTELSVFVFFIRLRRITSLIHLTFYARRPSGQQSDNLGSKARVYRKLNQFQKDLDQWRLSAPAFTSPKSLYERAEWYDFLLQRDRLSLIRGAILNLPKEGNVPPKNLLTICLDSATRTIKLFFTMLRNHDITWTKSYLQVIFTAGLTILYCMSLDVHKLAGGMAAEHAREALSLYGDVLRLLKAQQPEAGNFSFIFEAIQQKFLNGTGTSNDHLEIFGPMYSENGQQIQASGLTSHNPHADNSPGDVQLSLREHILPCEAEAAATEQFSPGDMGLFGGQLPDLNAGNVEFLDWFTFSDNMLENLDTDFMYQGSIAPPPDL